MKKSIVKLTLLLCCCLMGAAAWCQAAGDLALVGAKIYLSPTDAPIENGAVIIRNGKIVAVGSSEKVSIPVNARVIDCKGMFLTAALWNSHVHFIEPKWAHADLIPAAQFNEQMTQMLTSHGFAHVFDIAELNIQNALWIRDRIKKGDVSGPIIYTTGVPLVPAGGSPFYIEPLKLPEAVNALQAAAHVREQIDSGADGIKIWSASPTHAGIIYMPEDIGTAIVKAAHSLGRPVFAHPTDNRGAMIALECGVDVLAHTTPDGGRIWSADTIRRLISGHIALIPTLKLWKFELLRGGDKDWANHPLMTTAFRQLHDFAQAGGTVLFGTDVGYVTDYSVGDEYDFMKQAGLSFSQILASLTTAPAAKFKLSAKTGRVAAGMDGDIVVLKGDPAADIRQFDNVAYTILQGKIIYAAQ
jgi:imidazolonepropionase-like amidohydrolase